MIRASLRAWGVGRWLERRFFRPTIGLRWKLALGVGPAARILAGDLRMRRAARRLAPPAAPPTAAPFCCTFMTGARFWHQTAFCGHSLSLRLGRPLAVNIYDDGTLPPAAGATLLRLFPHGRIVGRAEAEAQVRAKLPPARFPALHDTRRVSVMMRKLVDPRASSSAWQLYLDSDMLFFRRPDWLESLAAAGDTAGFMVDHCNAYLRSLDALDALCGRPVARRVNAGLVALDDSLIDWERVERWCADFKPHERAGNVVEQTLTAMLLAWMPRVAQAPAGDYVLHRHYSPAPDCVLVHYIEAAKGIYAASEWQRALSPVA